MKPVDHNNRKRAINPEQSFIVQAPAGSGKTELLIQRYLRLLSLVESPEEIIAITFTRKAVAEMKNRILATLELAQSDQRFNSEHQRVTWDLANAALKQDAKIRFFISATALRVKQNCLYNAIYVYCLLSSLLKR